MISCKICSKETTSKEILSETYHFCQNCDFIFLDESDHISEKLEKERYLKHENSLDNEGYVDFLNDFIKKSVLPYKKEVKTILDFGSGPKPVLAELLKNEGFDVTTYDYYFDKNEYYKTKKYDLIVLVEVIEHLKDPLKILKGLKNLLNKNGKIAIRTIFHPQNPDKFKIWWYITDPTHISFFSEKTMNAIAERLGMKTSIIDEKNICVLSI